MQKTFELSSAMSFLIVDENESYRTSIFTALKRLGFREIQSCISSAQALRTLKSNNFDLIICDRNLPFMDGSQILKEIRESFDIRGTPFLMMGISSKVTKEDLVLLAEYEIDGYLTKPFTYKTLIEKITQCLEHYNNPNNTEFNISLAKEKLASHKPVEAKKIFHRLLDAMPQSARIRICLARCSRETGNYEEAIDYCRQAVAKNPLYAQSYDELAQCLLATGQTEDALDCFKNAISISPKYALRYEQLANLFIQKQLYDKAEFILTKAYENGANFEELDLRYGEVLFTLHKLDKAIGFLEKALVHFPQNKSLLNTLGICLKDLGRGEDALKHYNVALKRYPSDTKIMFNKALCLISLSRFEQAKKILQWILTVEPTNAKVTDKLAEMPK